MEYPLISEYKEAILSAEDNFNELASLRPVLDSHGDPVMSSGNFAVVFKMRDENNGKLYAVKCFIKDQEGRDESYRKIADELENVSSSYILPLRYLDNELFVDSAQCDQEEFPVVVMEWVEGETLDAYLNRNLNDKYELEILSYRFNRMAAWLLAQPFAHGDLKPDNILVRKDGSLVLVDYDGMFVPSMKGEKAREIGSPNYRHPSRTDADFDEHIDDFSIAVIALSLKAIALNPNLKTEINSFETLLFTEKDYRNPSNSEIFKVLQNLMDNSELTLLFGIFSISLARKLLDLVSFRIFMTNRPRNLETPKLHKEKLLSSKVTEQDLQEGIIDEYGVIYSKDGRRLLKCTSNKMLEYNVEYGTEIICDNAFLKCASLKTISFPNTVIIIGRDAFTECDSLENINISTSLTTVGDTAFSFCSSLKKMEIPTTVTNIGTNPFIGCSNLKITIPSNSKFKLINDLLIDSNGLVISCLCDDRIIVLPTFVTKVGDYAFYENKTIVIIEFPKNMDFICVSAFFLCSSLKGVKLPHLLSKINDFTFCRCVSLQQVIFSYNVTSIGNLAFSGCKSLKELSLPTSLNFIGNAAFFECETIRNLVIPDQVTTIGEGVFKKCMSLQYVILPNHLTKIAKGAFEDCRSLKSIDIPNSVISIERCTFRNCDSLKLICIPNSVTTIGDCAFEACGALQNVIIPDSVITIGKSAFSFCISLTDVVIPNSVIEIDSGAFSYCTTLQSVQIPSSVTHMGDGIFSGCDSLQNVDIPDSISKISDYAFSWCKSLQNVSFPSSITSIGICAFFGCDSLQNVALPNTQVIIEVNAFPKDCLVFVW